MARPSPPMSKPLPKKRAAAVAATRGPRRSTQGPPNAALNPSSASAVVNVVYGGLNHHGASGNSAWIGRLKVLHAYTDPMHTWTSTAPMGMTQRFCVEFDGGRVAASVMARTILARLRLAVSLSHCPHFVRAQGDDVLSQPGAAVLLRCIRCRHGCGALGAVASARGVGRLADVQPQSLGS